MSITHVQTLADLFEKSNAALTEARDAGATASLVVPSHKWAQTRKLQLKDVAPVGVDVLTHPQFIAQLWDVFGNGSTLISAQERSVILRPLVEEVRLFGAAPSPAFISQLGDFVGEAIYPGLMPSKELSESESKLMELVSLYESKLEHEGLVEIAQAECTLVAISACASMHVIYECPDLHSAHMRQFLSGLESSVALTVIEQVLDVSRQDDPSGSQDELRSLRQRLFTGVEGLQASGKVRVGEAHGAHVASDVIVGLVRALYEQNHIDYEGMSIYCASTADAFPRLHESLARGGIPFVTTFPVPCAQTGLGAAFCAIESMDEDAPDDASFEALVDLACSPYSGIAQEDARALQMRWRERAHSTYGERIHDVVYGFDQGNATAAMMQERLEPLARLLDATREECVSLLFEHAHDAHLDVDALIDDRQAAEALLDYLEICAHLSCVPHAADMANLPVTLSRSYGDASHALEIVDAHEAGPKNQQAVVMCQLDAARYPMATQSGPFDALMAKLGIERLDTLARDQRIFLRNTIEVCQEAFAFTRATSDAAGDECCQSALYDELLAVYRSKLENEEGLPVQAIPSALVPWSLSLNEADAFFAIGGSADGEHVVKRGGLLDGESLDDLTKDTKGQSLVFSPTALEDYYRCPYRWFSNRRTGYNGMDTTFDVAAQGNLVHAVMERFYRAFLQAGFERVTPENLVQAREMASAAFDEQLAHDQAKERRGLYLRTQLDARNCEEMRAGVLELVERDATFLPGFAPKYFELELGGKGDDLLMYAGVPVRGKVDRIDIDDRGNAIIIDYKLSKLSSGYGFDKDEGLPSRIQTDIYATLVERFFAARGEQIRVIGSVYRSYAKNILRGVYMRGISWGDIEERMEGKDALPRSNGESYAEYLVHVEQEMSNCVARMRSGDIAPAPLDKKACEFCKAGLFCPKKEA